MNREEILDRLVNDIISYKMSGAIAETTIARSLKPDGLDVRFDEYDLLLDLHFVLKPDVVEFVEDLSHALRHLRTETRNVSRLNRGGVTGRIDWQQTIKTRHSKHPRNPGIFVVENRTEDYDIPENLVVKRLLSQIYHTLTQAKDILSEDYEWVQQTWVGDADLIERLEAIVERNVHVRRIREPEAYEPTPRMISRAARSRQSLYRRAADLLTEYRAIHQGDESALRDLLTETIISPDDVSRLFELYVLFRVIDALESSSGSEVSVSTIRKGRDAVAHVQGPVEVSVYFDQSGPESLSFQKRAETPPEERTRFEDVHLTADELAAAFFRDDETSTTGRPDVLLEFRPPSGDPEYLVIEVKYSTNPGTVRRGIQETLEYLAFSTRDDAFLYPDEAPYGDEVSGVLVIQDTETETVSAVEQGEFPIRIVEAQEAETELLKLFTDRLARFHPPTPDDHDR